MTLRKVTVYTECRADFGLLKDLCLAIDVDKDLELILYADPQHFVHTFGYSYQEIIDAGLSCTSKEPFDTDMVIVLGDRFGALEFALDALHRNIPIIHISGGELTEGVVDDSIRHALTKLSHIHFTATKEYRSRVIQLGEQPDTVYNVGEPGLDNLPEYAAGDRRHYLVTYHPTYDDTNLSELFTALEAVRDKVIFTAPNKDLGYEAIIEKIQASNMVYMPTLGRDDYLKYMNDAIAVIGNSSSGIVEAPSLKIPVINIGDRQLGRIQAKNIINCKLDMIEIMEALSFVKNGFHETLTDCVNPYYKDGKAIETIIETLKTVDLKNILRKKFYDIKNNR